MLTRRNFLKNASFLTFSSLLVNNSVNASAATAIKSGLNLKPIGLQIYSLQKELSNNIPLRLKKIKEIGYSYIELAGYRDGKIGDIPMGEFKKMADDVNLKIKSTHVNPPVREYTKANQQQIADFWKKAADEHASIGVNYLIQPGQPSTRSVEEVSFVCEIFNQAGEIAKNAGLAFGYHNHEMEFARVVPGGNQMVFGRHGFSGEPPKGVEVIYDALINGTDPTLVFFEMDVYWTVMGQSDPIEYLKKYASRIKVLHIKDRAVLGQSGMMNFPRIFDQAYANGIKDYFVELEKMPQGQGSQFEGAKACADYLLNASFVR